MTEDRDQRTEVRGRKTEDGRRRSVGPGTKQKDGSPLGGMIRMIRFANGMIGMNGVKTMLGCWDNPASAGPAYWNTGIKANTGMLELKRGV